MHVSEGRLQSAPSEGQTVMRGRASVVDGSRPQPDQCQTVVGPVGPEIFMPEASLRPLGISSARCMSASAQQRCAEDKR